jgi:hypothetical protein
MATQAQIDANRRNAAQSTGPRSEAGKAAASRNAMKFGLFSKHLLLPDEDPAELEELRDDLFRRLKPADALERLYADRVVCAAWRLRRAIAGEAAVFAEWRGSYRMSPGQVHATQCPLEALDRLQKHIAQLERAMDRATGELRKLQQSRPEEEEDEEVQSKCEIEPNFAEEARGEQEGQGEVSGSAAIEIVRTKPIPPGASADVARAAATQERKGNCEIEANSPLAASRTSHTPNPITGDREIEANSP